MAIELVTGHSGSAHVSSADAGMLNLGIVGYSGVFEGMLGECTLGVQDNNTLVLGTGCGLLQGRFWVVSSPETVTIESGQQGRRRNGFVGIRYRCDQETGVESASVEARFGEFYAGDYRADMYPDDTFPGNDVNHGATDAFQVLWLVDLNGIQVEEIRRHDNEGPLIPSAQDLSAQIASLSAGKADATHAHAAGDITSGVLPIARGGTGATTRASALKALGIARGQFVGDTSTNGAASVSHGLGARPTSVVVTLNGENLSEQVSLRVVPVVIQVTSSIIQVRLKDTATKSWVNAALPLRFYWEAVL